MSTFVSLDLILGKDTKELTALKQGQYETEKLGLVPYSAISHEEYKVAKKDCVKMVPNGTGGMTPDIDDDRLMVKLIIAAVGKDERSNFTFASKELIAKLQAVYPDVVTAEQAVSKLLSPGEIYKLAMDIQNMSGFGNKAKEDLKKEVKNS